MSNCRIEADVVICKQPALPRHASVETSACDVVDIVLLRSLEDVQMEGEPDLIVELIDLFIEDTPQKLFALQRGLDASEPLAVRRAAHNLRGSSANMGARRMAAVCVELEDAGRCESLEGTQMLLTRLADEYECVLRVLESERRRRTSNSSLDSTTLEWELLG
jgi:two-component system, sensor histidine kinase and response regulator